MTKQSSIEALRQQLTQIEDLTEKQLNGLLQELESQKVKLPPEDHSIIDWGISVIRIKIRDEKRLKNRMSESSQYLDRKYANYQEFIEGLGWDNLYLNEQKDRGYLYDSGIKCLNEILSRSSKQGEGSRLLIYAKTFKSYLYRFCNEQQVLGLFKQVLNGYIEDYSDNYFQGTPKVATYAKKIAQYLMEN